MFKKMVENAHNAEVLQRNLGIRTEFKDIDVSSVKKYFNQKEGSKRSSKISGTPTSGVNRT